MPPLRAPPTLHDDERALDRTLRDGRRVALEVVDEGPLGIDLGPIADEVYTHSGQRTIAIAA